MDGGDRRRSQYGHPYQTPDSSQSTTTQSMGPPPSDRYSHPSTPVRNDLPRASLARTYLSTGYSGFGYHDQQYTPSQMQSSSPLQGVDINYTPAYLTERQPQTPQSQSQQQYAPYTPASILPPVGSQSIYENLPQFPSRQSGSIEVMSNNYPLNQYLQHNDSATIGIGTNTSQYLTSQPGQSNLTSLSLHRPTLQQGFGANVMDYSILDHQPAQETQTATGGQTANVDGLRDYELQIKGTFEAVIAGRLTEASTKLLDLSRWLLGSIVNLGLHHDDEDKYAERLFLWQQFNLCWEALGQKQKHVTEEALRTRRQPIDILTAENVQSLVDELVNLGDQVEQYGLVDYEMGIWEEQIVEIFSICSDLLQREETRAELTQSRSD